MRLKTKYLIFINELATTTAFTAIEKKLILVMQSKKVIIKQNLLKLKIKLLLIMIMIDILLLKNLISQ